MTEDKKQVLRRWKAAGYSAEDIAVAHEISVQTVREHTDRSPFNKLLRLKPWVKAALLFEDQVPEALVEFKKRYDMVKGDMPLAPASLLARVMGVEKVPTSFLSTWVATDQLRVKAKLWVSAKTQELSNLGH